MSHLASAFHQVEKHPDDRSKKGASTLGGHFEYLKIPLRIENAPVTFQHLMDVVLKGMHGTEAFVYLYNIVINSETLEE